jgi:ATP phosphoribosyltransferase regulatory subunit
MIYTAFVPNEGKGIAFGGRYDDIGSAFGKARPATGFSTDVKQLLELQNISEEMPDKIFAPVNDNDSLHKKITELREQGKIVIQELEGQNIKKIWEKILLFWGPSGVTKVKEKL